MNRPLFRGNDPATKAQKRLLIQLLIKVEWIDAARAGQDRLNLQFRRLCFASGLPPTDPLDPPLVNEWLDKLSLQQASDAIKYLKRVSS